uniref:Uncharacterized protein n=1 Tax=Avena sativa TaxID=4498 RepID=A0ACD6AX78_AVESA
MAKGSVLRVKIKLNIKKPLMRGVMVQVGNKEKERWCPLEYEFLPAFCWTCGLIGHTDKACSIVLKKGEEPQFGNWLKYKPARKNSVEDEARQSAPQRRGGGYPFGKDSGGSRSGSDSLSWRKDACEPGQKEQISGEDREVTSPLKLTSREENSEANAVKAKKQLLLAEERGATVENKMDAVVIEAHCAGDRVIATEPEGTFHPVQAPGNHVDQEEPNKVDKEG